MNTVFLILAALYLCALMLILLNETGPSWSVRK